MLIVTLSGTALSQNLSVDQWLNLFGADSDEAFDYFVDLGTEAVPILQDAAADRWRFHAYIPQRNNIVKVMATINDISTLPVLKSALIMEPTIRSDAVDAILAIEELSMSDLLIELLIEPVDYQAAQLEILRKLVDQNVDVIGLLTEVFDGLAEKDLDSNTIDYTADLLTWFIIEDKQVVVPPQKITREMIMAAILQQQQAQEQEDETSDLDINEQLYQFLIDQAKHKNSDNRALALRTIGRLGDLARGLEIAAEYDINQFTPLLIEVLENNDEIMNNRRLAALALEQNVLVSRQVWESFVNIIDTPKLDNQIKWAAVRTLEAAGADYPEQAYQLWQIVCNNDLEPTMKWRLASVFVRVARQNEQLITLINESLAAGLDDDMSLYAQKILAAVEPTDLDNETETSHVEETVLAFPGAEGCGAYATGGRGGEVYIVTNIKNSGPGSLRDAISKPNRTVVFAISGTIESRAQLKSASNITIAGQTAPGDGITVADYPFLIGGSNSIVRFMRFRLGEREGLTSSDALNVDRYINNVIIDHCSVSWGTDEVFSSYDNENITVQYSMLGEGLNWLNHSAGGLWGPRSTYHHNLIYSNKTRSPKLAYLGDIVEFNNNVIYNWRERSVYTGSQGMINFVGNYYKPGPETNAGVRGQLVDPDGANVRLFIEGNVIEGNEVVSEDNWRGVTKSAAKMSVPYESAPMTIHSAEEAFDLVIAEAGAYLPRRDQVDQRVINEVLNGTGKVILRQSEVGGFSIMNSTLAPVDSDKDGMPDMWEIYYGLNPFDPTDGNDDRTQDGYTNLEEYLNALLEEHVLWP